jgi:hypothetical protein
LFSGPGFCSTPPVNNKVASTAAHKIVGPTYILPPLVLLFVMFYLIVLYFLIIRFVCFLVFYVLLSILFVLFSRIVLCTVSPYVHSRLFSIVVQFYRPLPPGGNSIAVNKYRRHNHHHHHHHHVIQYFTFVICSL